MHKFSTLRGLAPLNPALIKGQLYILVKVCCCDKLSTDLRDLAVKLFLVYVIVRVFLVKKALVQLGTERSRFLLSPFYLQHAVSTFAVFANSDI